MKNYLQLQYHHQLKEVCQRTRRYSLNICNKTLKLYIQNLTNNILCFFIINYKSKTYFLKMLVDLTHKFLSLLPENYLSQTSTYSPSSSSHSPSSPRSSSMLIPIQSQLLLKQSLSLSTQLSKICSILQQNKDNYFSNAAYSSQAFTDPQRSQFNQQMKKMLDDVNEQIGEMKEVVQKLNWQSTTQRECFGNGVLCLYQEWKKVCKLFNQFVEFGANRKKKLQNMLGQQIKKQQKLAFKQSKPLLLSSTPSESSRISEDPLQSQTLQIFQQKLSESKKIQQTYQKLSEISNILSLMQNKVLEQELLTSSFRQIGQIGLFHIQKGNKNLVDANAISKQGGKLWTMFFLGLALSLLILDYLKS